MASRQSELELLEVPRGPYRMTQVINQQSKAPIFGELSQCNGNTLLLSTLDLQESLIMLGKLQAMNNVSQAATRNLMEEIEIEIIRSELRQASKKCAVNRCNNRLDEERLFSNSSNRCSSRNGELKKVIRGGLCARNALSSSSDGEKASTNWSYASFISSVLDVSYEVERNRNCSSTSLQQSMRMRSTSLIAKRMGLEEIPSKAMQPKEENSRPQGFMFSTEAPNETRKPTIVDQNLRPTRTLLDAIEREHLERSRRVHQVNESGVFSSDTSSHEEESYLHEGTLRMAGLKATPCTKREFQEYYPSNENFNQKIGRSTKGVTDESELEKGRQSDTFRSPLKTEMEASKVDEEAKWIMNFKTVSSDEFQGDHTPDSISKTKIKFVSQQIILDDAHELSKEKKRKTIRKSEKTKVELSQKSRKPTSLNNIQNRKETVASSKQIDPSQKSKISEMGSENTKHNKVKPVQTARQNIAVLDKRCSVLRSASGQVKHCGTSQTKPTPRNFTTPPRRKQNETNQTQNFNTSEPVKKKDVTTISSSCKIVSLIRKTSCNDQHPQEKGHDLKSSIKDKMRKDQKDICEVMPKGRKVGQPCKLETTTVSDGADTTAKTSEMEDFKGLLLKNRSFLKHAYELCTGAQQTLLDESERLYEEVKDEKLYLACANELMARQSIKELSKHSMSTIGMKLSAHAFLDQLVGVISRGIRTLCNYSKVADDDTSNDGLYVRLKRDMECKDMMLSSMWDVTWWNGISLEEADQVADQVEETILLSLVEDTVIALLH